MKRVVRRWIVTVAVAVAGAPVTGLVVQSRAADVDPTAATTTPTSTTAPTAPASPASNAAAVGPKSPTVAVIQQADSPSAAVDAYARAAAADGGVASVPAQAAYVRKMVDLNMPELADAQASELVRRDASNGLAWAVVAYMAAAHGDSGLAARDLVVALRHAPDDPFVLRTAAQVVAWYDAQPEHPDTNDADRQAIDTLRSAGADKPAFADAYRTSLDMQRDARASAANANANASGPTTAPTSVPSSPPAVAYYPTDATYDMSAAPVAYTYPYYSSPYAYGGYGRGCWGWGSGWCGFPGAIIVSDFAFVHGFCHNGSFNHNHFSGHFHGSDDFGFHGGHGFTGGARFFDARSSHGMNSAMMSRFGAGGFNRMGAAFRGPISSPQLRGTMSMSRSPMMMRSAGGFGGAGGGRAFAGGGAVGGRMR